jgi:hypothetical protein
VDQFAQFIHVFGTDDPFHLPDSGKITRDFHFDLKDLNPERTAVVMFLVKAQGTVRLSMWFNDNPSDDLSFTFQSSDPESMRSFHEVLQDARRLTDGRNKLSIQADGGPGEVRISDVVLLYHAQA